MFVSLFVFGGELFLEAQEVVGGIPLVDGGVVVDLVGIAEERGAEVSGALAKELRPVAFATVILLEGVGLVAAHAIFPDDLQHQRIPTSPRTEPMSFCG